MKQILFIAAILITQASFAKGNFFKTNTTVQLQVGHQTPIFTYDAGQLQTIHSTPLHPKIGLSFDKQFRVRKNFNFLYGVNALYLKMPYEEQAFGFGAEIGYQVRIYKPLHFSQQLGVQYNRGTFVDVQYQYSNNKWEPISNSLPAQNRRNIFLRNQLGYSINKRVDVSALFQVDAVTPYFQDIVSFYAYKNFGVGIQYKF
jgi:hypothetical protein